MKNSNGNLVGNYFSWLKSQTVEVDWKTMHRFCNSLSCNSLLLVLLQFKFSYFWLTFDLKIQYNFMINTGRILEMIFIHISNEYQKLPIIDRILLTYLEFFSLFSTDCINSHDMANDESVEKCCTSNDTVNNYRCEEIYNFFYIM